LISSTVCALYVAGLVSAAGVVAGFGDPVVVFIAALFVVAEGLDAAGVTNWAGQRLTERAGGSARLLLTVLMLLCAVFAALVTPNAAVAALLPMVVFIAGRTDRPPSRMLIPLAFGGSAGSLLALTGSPVNVVVSQASAEAGAGSFGFLEFGIVGLPLVLVTTALAVWVGPLLLPARSAGSATRDLSRHARTLATHYELWDGFYRLRVREGSPLVGQTTAGLHLDRYPGVRLIAAQHGSSERVAPDDRLAVDDVLALALLLTNALPIIERAAPIHGVIQAAATDPEVAEQLRQNEAHRFATMQTYALELAAKPGFAPDLSADTAADILYAIFTADVYRRLVIERHRPRERWRNWIHDIAVTQLFPGLRRAAPCPGDVTNSARRDRAGD
jgi:hypothetical protein